MGDSLLQSLGIFAHNEHLELLRGRILNPVKLARRIPFTAFNALAAEDALFVDCGNHGGRVPHLARQRQSFLAGRL